MKKIALLLAIILIISSPLSASATARSDSILPQLTINGTTATCTVAISSNLADEIQVTMRLMHRSAYIAAWTASGTGYVSLNKTATVTPGNTYTLVVQVTINGVTKPPVAVSKTC